MTPPDILHKATEAVMGEIPRDIRQVALSVIGSIADKYDENKRWDFYDMAEVVADALAEERSRCFAMMEQILHDPENQPSQFGTVPASWVKK